MKLSHLALPFLLLTTGCMMRPGMHDHEMMMHHPMMHDTLGSRLIDLKEAHDRGAITDDEYAQLKQKEIELVEHHDEGMGGACSCGGDHGCMGGSCGGGSCGEEAHEHHHHHQG